MRKTVSLVLAICGTLLLLLLFATGRLIYTHVYSQDFSDIAETGPQSTITLTENDVEVPQTDDNQKTAIIQLLSEQTYTAYPHFIKPSQQADCQPPDRNLPERQLDRREYGRLCVRQRQAARHQER